MLRRNNKLSIVSVFVGAIGMGSGAGQVIFCLSLLVWAYGAAIFFMGE